MSDDDVAVASASAPVTPCARDTERFAAGVVPRGSVINTVRTAVSPMMTEGGAGEEKEVDSRIKEMVGEAIVREEGVGLLV